MVKICIDPGHGGENLGAEWEEYTEKEMTLVVANAMKEELEQYDDIEVIMTRTSDEDLSLAERVEIAQKNGADFFFCLHFNMSVNHDIYGTENWISAFGSNYARGMDFAKIEMQMLTDLGLYDRGIKTRLNNKGTNYYGVLRIADEANIPGVIIEHCHLDNPNDNEFYDGHDWLVQYGKLDATAVAKYYGLKSESLGKDYSDFSYEKTPVPDHVVKPDLTEPEYCSIAVSEPMILDDGAYIPVQISASDSDCRMLYYSYSYDGGINYSERFRWIGKNGETGNEISADVWVPFGKDIALTVNAYNLYDLVTASDTYHIAAIDEPVAIPEVIESEELDGYKEYETISPYNENEPSVEDVKENKDYFSIVVISLSLAVAIVLFGFGYFIFDYRRRLRKSRRKKKRIDKRD